MNQRHHQCTVVSLPIQQHVRNYSSNQQWYAPQTVSYMYVVQKISLSTVRSCCASNLTLGVGIEKIRHLALLRAILVSRPYPSCQITALPPIELYIMLYCIYRDCIGCFPNLPYFHFQINFNINVKITQNFPLSKFWCNFMYYVCYMELRRTRC